MALSIKRYREVNAELQHMQVRLQELAAELDAAAPMTDKQEFTSQFAQQVSAAVAHLRSMLKLDQGERCRGEKLRQCLYAKHKRSG